MHGGVDFNDNKDNAGFDFGNVFKGMTGLSDLVGAFASMKGLGLAKDQFNFQKDAFGVNLANQANLINADLSDRQRRRNIESGDNVPLAQYMAQFGVSGNIDGSNSFQQQAPVQGQAPQNILSAPQQQVPQNVNAAAMAQFGQPVQAPRRL